MKPIFRALLTEAQAGAARRFARWDAAAFEARCASPLAQLERGLKESQDEDRRLFASYARALVEASGRGWLVQQEDGDWANLLSWGLLTHAPRAMAWAEGPARLERLREIWCLGEGLLLEEPAWLNRYVADRSGEFWRSEPLAPWLEEVLTPVLRPLPDARWTGPFTTICLDLREGASELLPGAFHLPTPTLLYVQNRLDDAEWVSILLQPGGKSEVVGGACIEGPLYHPSPRVPVRWSEDQAEVGGSVAAMPYLGLPDRWLLHPGGFLIATAEDSQRLWIAESP